MAFPRGFPLNVCGPAIRRHRLGAGLSQAELARRSQLAGWDISRETVAIIEAQKRIVADFELMALAEALNIAAEKLLPPAGTHRASD